MTGDRTGDVTGVSVSNWLIKPPRPSREPRVTRQAARPPRFFVLYPETHRHKQQGTSLNRSVHRVSSRSLSFSSPSDLPSVRRMDLRREDLAAETCSFSRSGPYRPDGAGGALLGALASFIRAPPPAAPSALREGTLAPPRRRIRVPPPFPAAAAFLIRAAHRSVLIAFDLTAGVGVSRGFLSGPEGFGGALLEEPSFLIFAPDGRASREVDVLVEEPAAAGFRSAARLLRERSPAFAGCAKQPRCPPRWGACAACRGARRLPGSPKTRLFRGVGSLGS